MATRTNADIIKGSKLMVFMAQGVTGTQGPIGFATNHSMSITTNTTEIATKDHGDYPSIIPQNITWEVTAENLFSNAGAKTYLDAQLNKEPVTVAFVESNYSNVNEKGIIGQQGSDGTDDWVVGVTGTQGQPNGNILTGPAYITSVQVNAPQGDNATLSVTFTGAGDLTKGSILTQ